MPLMSGDMLCELLIHHNDVSITVLYRMTSQTVMQQVSSLTHSLVH